MKNAVLAVMTGVMTLGAATVPAHPREHMASLDTDGDGQISREEFQLPEQRRGPQLFERADLDGDGVITREELLASIDSASQEHSERMRDRLIGMFDAMDEDGNSVVTRQEAEDHAFARLDSDGDGFITEAEAQAAMDRRRGQWSQRREATS